jgi:hypothetical protein
MLQYLFLTICYSWSIFSDGLQVLYSYYKQWTPYTRKQDRFLFLGMTSWSPNLIVTNKYN